PRGGRPAFPQDQATERLNALGAAADGVVYSESPTSGRRLRTLVSSELPRSVRAGWRFILVSFLALAIPLFATLAIGILLPEIAAAALPAETRAHLAERRLWTDIPEGFRPVLGPLIIVNNVQVAIAALAGGLTAGALTLYILGTNGSFLRIVLALYHYFGMKRG